jgi:hypothetical protein
MRDQCSKWRNGHSPLSWPGVSRPSPPAAVARLMAATRLAMTAKREWCSELNPLFLGRPFVSRFGQGYQSPRR